MLDHMVVLFISIFFFSVVFPIAAIGCLFGLLIVSLPCRRLLACLKSHSKWGSLPQMWRDRV